MEWLTVLFNQKKEIVIKTVADHRREALVEQGREQFETLIAKGLTIPVAHL